MKTQPIRFLRRGQVVSLTVETNRTLLDLLREDLHCTGTKEGCGEGDCGACTVVVGEEKNGQLELNAINSCIRMAHSVDGLAVWTVEDLKSEDGALHPVQESLVQCHGSQCGFCTPGFAMSLFGLYEKTPATQSTANKRKPHCQETYAVAPATDRFWMPRNPCTNTCPCGSIANRCCKTCETWPHRANRQGPRRGCRGHLPPPGTPG